MTMTIFEQARSCLTNVAWGRIVNFALIHLCERRFPVKIGLDSCGPSALTRGKMPKLDHFGLEKKTGAASPRFLTVKYFPIYLKAKINYAPD